MKNNAREVFLQFDFKRGNGAEQAPLLFSEPIEVITTHRLESVPSCLKKMDDALDNGYYVAGYCSYDIIYALIKETATTNKLHNKMPLLWFGVFQAPAKSVVGPNRSGHFHVGDWQMQISKRKYEDDFYKVMEAIEQQKTKQINYTVPFQANFKGDAYAYYDQLKKAQQSNYCAFLEFDHYQILSASPELFFQIKNDDITVRPMKGTAPRGKTSKEDQQQKEWLLHSNKNKLENKLITELMAKELEKVTKKDSIRIINPYQIETYPTVFQMTTTVTGKLRSSLTMTDILKALYPCGSISGVPKTASLALIREIENNSREVYCGAIGYITPEKEAIFNVPIRTVWVDEEKQQAHYGAGGAITSKSQMQEEYEEVLTKTNVLTWQQPTEFHLLETLAIYDGEIIVLEEHINRLVQSASYFAIPVNQAAIREQLLRLTQTYSQGHWRIRLTVSKDGVRNLDVFPLEELKGHHIMLAKKPIDRSNVFLHHKTTYRSFYDDYRHQAEKVFDVLLWNENEEITECTIGNIVVEIDDELFTPPISSGLLAGTYREKLLREGKIKERIILKRELSLVTQIWLINSVRQWVKVELM